MNASDSTKTSQVPSGLDDCDDSAGVDPPCQPRDDERVEHCHNGEQNERFLVGEESSRSMILGHRGQLAHGSYKIVLFVGGA